MTREMENHLVDPELRKWVMPSFTTTTDTDIVTASVLMMGALQKYFSYMCGLTCGIPSVTLMGERDDWVDICGRLDKLSRFGKEPEQFGRLLTPVLDHFIGSFDRPTDPQIVDFWSKIADKHSGGSGPDHLSGWITAFCFWDAEGHLLYKILSRIRDKPSSSLPPSVVRVGMPSGQNGCDISGTVYHRVDMDKIPGGYVGVPVKVNDHGHEVQTRMVAGSIAIAASSSGGNLDTSTSHTAKSYITKSGERGVQVFTPVVDSETGLDSLRPVTGWWMYEVKD